MLQAVTIYFKRYKNFHRMSATGLYNEIIPQIKRLYETYEERANQHGEERRRETGNKADRAQQDFLRGMAMLEENLGNLVGEMKKNEKGSPNEFREHLMAIEDCLKDIRIILKKKSLNFKVNPQIKQIIDDTDSSLIAVRKDLATIKDTKFLCCGTDGGKKFKTPMNYFKIAASKWKMLTLFEPKDGIETFISPKFNQGDYRFIGDILKKKWPEERIREVEKPVIKEVIKEVVRNTGTKPNRLHDANQFIYGINKEENIIQGLNIYHEEADSNGNPQACAFLGKVYEEGTLLPMDLKKSMMYYQKAINGKEPYANYRYALCLINGKFSRDGQNKEDIEKAFEMLTQISNESPEAMAELGEIYEFGNFQNDSRKLFTIKKDEKKAKNFYTRAKAMNLSRASNNLAVLLLNNKLSEKDNRSEVTNNNQIDRTIITLLTQSQEQGFSQAYYNLGVIYSKGLIGQKNSQLALKMFYEGSIKGDYKCKIQFAYELMNQTSIMKEEYEDHYHLAIHWLESVVRKLSIDEENISTIPSEIIKAERGEALFYLGIFHQHGFGVEKSPKKAISYFIESSECDYAPAKNKIGDCYFSGYGIKQDRQLAVGCYLQAAEMGNSDAMVNLGTVYLNGIPNLVQKSYKKAYEYFLNAHQLQNSDAMIHLSYMYRTGLGVDPNESVARDLLQQAAQLKNATALYMLRQQGLQFNEGVLFQHLENQFFSAPKKINMKSIVPAVNSVYKSK